MTLSRFSVAGGVADAYEIATFLRTPSGGAITKAQNFEANERDAARAYFEEQKQDLILRTARQALGVGDD